MEHGRGYREFQDAIALRYNYPIKGVAKLCNCGDNNTVDHCLICKKSGYISLRQQPKRHHGRDDAEDMH